MWIDAGTAHMGDVYFLVEIQAHLQRTTRYALLDSPLRTNMSGEPRLTGWCGTTNDLARFARGIVRVTRFSAAGDRAWVEPLRGEERDAWLAEHGWPELIPHE